MAMETKHFYIQGLRLTQLKASILIWLISVQIYFSTYSNDSLQRCKNCVVVYFHTARVNPDCYCFMSLPLNS